MSENNRIDLILHCGQERSDGGYCENAARFTLGTSGAVIGRDPVKCAVKMELPYVSREHARISCLGDEFFVEDVGSTEGTLLNGKQMDPRRKYSARNDDVLTIGDYELQLTVRPWYDPAVTKLAPSDVDDDGDGTLPTNDEGDTHGAFPHDTSKTSEQRVIKPPPADDKGVQQFSQAGHDLIDAFLKGAGLPSSVIGDDPNARRLFMETIGELLLAAVDGVRKALIAQDRFREHYRAPGTRFRRPQANLLRNEKTPTRVVLESLLSASSAAIMPPLAALEDVQDEFYLHGRAVPIAVDQAVRAAFDTLNWREIESSFDSGAGWMLVETQKKARLWQCFCQKYDEARKGLDEFDNHYRREIARAYADERIRARQDLKKRRRGNAK